MTRGVASPISDSRMRSRKCDTKGYFFRSCLEIHVGYI